jgi:hypothetical protein
MKALTVSSRPAKSIPLLAHQFLRTTPVDLRLLASKHLEFQKQVPGQRTQPRNGSSQLHDAAIVTAIANHLVGAE